MKLIICVLNYVDTIDIFIDGIKINIKKLSLFSKAEFELEVEKGIHEVVAIKKSSISDSGWKKRAVFDWISFLLGVPDWTLSEKKYDENKFWSIFKVNVIKNAKLTLKLTNKELELVEDSGILLETEKKTETSKLAKKRIRNVYLIPIILISLGIEAFLIVIFCMLVIGRRWLESIVVFALSAFWIWLIYSKISNHNK